MYGALERLLLTFTSQSCLRKSGLDASHKSQSRGTGKRHARNVSERSKSGLSAQGMSGSKHPLPMPSLVKASKRVIECLSIP
jgi:hypothetical protein